MTWAVDTCIVLDVLEGDPEFGLPSARLLDALAGEGLTLCPVSFVELAPAFLGETRRQQEFLESIGVQFLDPWDWKDTQLAYKAWDRYVGLRRSRRIARRPVADILIGAFACGRKGLLTRNGQDFAAIFPNLKLKSPMV